MKALNFKYASAVVAIAAMLISATALESGCKKKSKNADDGGDTVVAKFEGGEITRAEFEKELMAKHGSAPIDTNDRVIEKVLNEMIETRIVELEAKKMGIASDPDIEARVLEYRRHLIMQEFIDRKLKSAGEIDRGVLNKYYNDHLAEYEEVRLRDILIRIDTNVTEEGLAELKRKSAEILAKAKAGEDFADLAVKYSDDLRFKNKGGDTGFVSLNSLPSQGPMRKAIEGMQPGEVAPEVIADYSGFHVVMLVEKRTVTFEKVEDTIKAILTQQNRETGLVDLMKKLKADYKTQVFENKVKKLPPGGLPEGHP